MLIISVGIERVVCQRRYHAGGESRDMFATAGVSLWVKDESVEQYANQ
jgi:dCMP deaminase